MKIKISELKDIIKELINDDGMLPFSKRSLAQYGSWNSKQMKAFWEGIEDHPDIYGKIQDWLNEKSATPTKDALVAIGNQKYSPKTIYYHVIEGKPLTQEQ